MIYDGLESCGEVGSCLKKLTYLDVVGIIVLACWKLQIGVVDLCLKEVNENFNLAFYWDFFSKDLQNGHIVESFSQFQFTNFIIILIFHSLSKPIMLSVIDKL
jgi:hypothetical protein